MNNIRYCKRCGRIFNYKVSFFCQSCIIQNDKDFITCREYIDKNKFVTIKELSENTEVPEKVILLFLKEGRLSLNEGSGLNCEKCGAPVSKGRFCDNCFTEMKSDFDFVRSELAGDKDKNKNSSVKPSYSSADRMHTARRINVDKEKSK